MTDSSLRSRIHRVIADEPVVDMHTHLYPPAFGTPFTGKADTPDPNGLMLWGIDALLTYHYLIAEVFRVVPATILSYDAFWSMTIAQQADHIWKHLFTDRLPVSEACRGVLTTLASLGLDPNEQDLNKHRQWFAEQSPNDYTDLVMQKANVKSITMTNNPFDPNERQRWLDNPSVADDPRFSPVLRIDELLTRPDLAAETLNPLGYNFDPSLPETSLNEARRFLSDWIQRIRPIYLAASLPPTFTYDDPSAVTRRMLDKAVLPLCREHDLPFAMMIGTIRQINPSLHSAGDTLGKANALAIANLCADNPQNRFLATLLSRESQHELCVTARKIGKLTPFGCWWFLNNPSIITEITTQRLELLGTTFIPQHSDARVLDQLIYKWSHSRTLIAEALTKQLQAIEHTGYQITDEMIHAEARRLLSGNFLQTLAQH
ncbi:glucuronate isomerase [Mucisphaera sp.]|uniref:glucuronate isomerase n=1 Tax=Mucisphaera sp. TaxID=2913024 RepID=UPI003D0EAE4A